MFKNRLNKIKNKFKQVLKLESTPKKIAIGVAIAVFWNFLPSLGVGPFLSAFAARLLGGSIVAAVTVNLGTGALIPLFYTLNVMVGRFVMGGETTGLKLTEMVRSVFSNTIDFLEGLLGQSQVETLLASLETFSVGFLIGSIINSLLAGILLYCSFYYLLIKREQYREKLRLEENNLN
ncbi:DUF2062 domain-containing protein [Natranaerobius thermophilus]|uniref:DUF2062 domain-containing protein n=1 Tax=Natranaerobius thermophilus (strain ATCC BAA-1301 / DSM 18059 / JW/NM-WN-LF) TaxID=457570 RepID=B2A6U7_NATTJ|nr:DUF2062 domain-containing protein [Natranaerobius thermophilus]ACB84228.1 conserved hypothetical protein [Natranaerobius thermophilus JW/NM-WN-LF]